MAPMTGESLKAELDGVLTEPPLLPLVVEEAIRVVGVGVVEVGRPATARR